MESVDSDAKMEIFKLQCKLEVAEKMLEDARNRIEEIRKERDDWKREAEDWKSQVKNVKSGLEQDQPCRPDLFEIIDRRYLIGQEQIQRRGFLARMFGRG